MRKRTATKVFCLGLCNADQSLRKSSVKAALAMSRRTLKQTLSLGHGISHGGIIKVSLGLLCLGKSDFDAIENYRHDQYFKASLGIDQVPSASRLRQRLDADADTLPPVMYEQSIEFLVEAKVPVSRLSTGPVALDIDVFPLDNSKTRKEGVSRTYKSYAGYAPIAAYLGQEGWYLARELRDGSRHRQNAFLDTLERVIPHVRRLTSAPLLVRRESGHDALETRATVVKPAVDFILKWNPRRQEREGGLAQAEAQGHWESPREGKRVALFSLFETQTYQGQPYGFRKVIRVIERTIDKHGQQLLIPDIELEGGWTTLQATDHADDQVIALYRDHATSEQFHGELKTDLDIERLPSGKFATNALIMTLATCSYNMPRWIGLISLVGDISPVRHPAQRRRLKTVIQELMSLAARLIETGRRLTLRFCRHCPGYPACYVAYHRLASG